MSENPKKKLTKEAPDKVITPEQAIVNSAITQAAALVEISECLNDLVEVADTIRELTIKKYLHEGIINPTEADEYRPQTIDDPEDDEL